MLDNEGSRGGPDKRLRIAIVGGDVIANGADGFVDVGLSGW